MTIAQLRKENPGWQWSAERYGFGYRYTGERNGEFVAVYAVSVVVGFVGDDYETQWRVDNGKSSETYASWWLDQQAEQEAANGSND